MDMTLAALQAEAAAIAEALGGRAEPTADGAVIRLAAGRRALGAPGQAPEPGLAVAVAAGMPGLLAALGEAVRERMGGGGDGRGL